MGYNSHSAPKGPSQHHNFYALGVVFLDFPLDAFHPEYLCPPWTTDLFHQGLLTPHIHKGPGCLSTKKHWDGKLQGSRTLPYLCPMEQLDEGTVHSGALSLKMLLLATHKDWDALLHLLFLTNLLFFNSCPGSAIVNAPSVITRVPRRALVVTLLPLLPRLEQ